MSNRYREINSIREVLRELHYEGDPHYAPEDNHLEDAETRIRELIVAELLDTNASGGFIRRWKTDLPDGFRSTSDGVVFPPTVGSSAPRHPGDCW